LQIAKFKDSKIIFRKDGITKTKRKTNKKNKFVEKRERRIKINQKFKSTKIIYQYNEKQTNEMKMKRKKK
jgi:hypothetical protein